MPEEIDQVTTHHKHSFWEHHLGRWQQSSLSQRVYCRQNDLRPHQFYYWRRRRMRQSSPSKRTTKLSSRSIPVKNAVVNRCPRICPGSRLSTIFLKRRSAAPAAPN